jgi:hypothetical protein
VLCYNTASWITNLAEKPLFFVHKDCEQISNRFFVSAKPWQVVLGSCQVQGCPVSASVMPIKARLAGSYSQEVQSQCKSDAYCFVY